MPARIDRTGETNTNTEGYSLKIVAYQNNKNMDVEIDSKHIVKCLNYKNFKAGAIKNPYHRSVHGIGYLGIGKHKPKTPAHKVWCNMIKKSLKHGDDIIDAWHNFQLFADWYDSNVYACAESLAVNKDILQQDSKIYSPDTAVLIPDTINDLVSYARKRTNDLLTGVSEHTKGFKARIMVNGKHHHLGAFDTPEQAHEVYVAAKTKRIRDIIDNYKGIIKPDKLYERIKEALYNHEVPRY
jgi:hypothetical protein